MLSRVRDETIRWTPETDGDRQLVQQELSAILASSHFRNSKRYPALLRYVVERTLDGDADQLKERTLGVEVFDRRPDYDTNSDPVVRFSASEVRKRLAQHYREAGATSSLQIDLPLGSYAPEFCMFLTASEEDATASHTDHAGAPPLLDPLALDPRPPHPEETSVHPAPADTSRRPRSLIASLVLASLMAGVLLWGRGCFTTKPIDLLWNPILRGSSQVLIVIGSGSKELVSPEAGTTTLYDHMIGPYHHVSLSSAVALSRLTDVIAQHGRTFTVKEPQATSLTDLRERSTILIGGLNNPWALRMIQPLRFHFVEGPMARVEDSAHPDNQSWAVNFNQPYTSIQSDYAIVARFHNGTSNANVLFVGGLGPFGTEAASEFVSSPQYLEQMLRLFPGLLNGTNVELVLRTDIIAGEAGPAHVVAATTF